MFLPGCQDRDARDRITSFQKGSGNPTNPMEDGRGDHYWYDAEGQLTEAYYGAVNPVTNPQIPVRSDYFSYDELGSRKGSNYVASRYAWLGFGRKDNRLNQYLGWYSTVKYDEDIGGTWGTPQHANGVMMMDGNVTAGYNALNQPMMIWSANNPSGKWLWFGFDPLGRCVKRWYAQADGSGAGAPTYFAYDGWNLVQEGYSPWSPNRFYIHGGSVDEIVQSYNSGTGLLAYHYYDASGHCTLLTDGQGNIKEQYYYDAFGYPYFYNGLGNWLGYSPHGNRFLFTGREWLSELKLYDFRHRLYQPELGRFLQPDPKHFAAGDYNLYRYCHNDPVNRSDPFGFADSAGVTFEPQEGKLIIIYTTPNVIQSFGDSRGLAVSLPILNTKQDYGITTSATKDPSTGDINVQQSITVKTLLPNTEKALGPNSSLAKREAERVNDFRGLARDADAAARGLAGKGFKDADSAKKSVEDSTKKILKDGAFQLKLKYDLLNGNK